MRGYTQLVHEQRYQIYALMKADHTQTEIAEILGVHKSTISRELRRNCGLRGYRPKQAHGLAMDRQANRATAHLSDSTWPLVDSLLREDWSPEQISCWLKLFKNRSISHEWIYQYIYQDKLYGGTLHQHLRCKKKRRKRYGSYDRRGQIINRVSIDERPAIVDKRRRIGDWELDTVIGKAHQQAIVTITERKTRLSLIRKVKFKTAENVADAIIELLGPMKKWVKTLTADNGKEFAFHERIAKALNAKFYFAHPYSSWERGLNENTNGLIRQYLPKKTDFKKVTQKQIDNVMEKLNNRPRKCLGFKTPNQVFFGINPTVALQS